MKIIVKEKLSDHIVKFKSNLGYGAANWENNKPPKLNTSYDIELDIDDFFEWEKNISLKKNKSSIYLFNNKIFLVRK
jgi:hypothetical protein